MYDFISKIMGTAVPKRKQKGLSRRISRCIDFIVPGALARYHKKLMLQRAYDAAKLSGANRRFRPRQSSGATEISDGWRVVTDKARDLDRNNSHVAGMRRRFVMGLVGQGSWPRPKVLRPNSADKHDFDVELNNEMLRRFEYWVPNAAANNDTFYQVQRLAASHYFLDGGILIRRIIKKTKRGAELRLEPIELDRLDTAKDSEKTKGRIVNGIELDEYNAPIAYWIKPRHPGEVNSESVRVPAEDVIHLYDRQRASAVSGISRLAPAIMNLHNIGRYRADMMTLARVATGYGIFIESDMPDEATYAGEEGTDEDGVPYDYVTPGGVHRLQPGEKMSQTKPENPGTQYEPFLRAELRSASVGAGMSYESASNDGSQSNFSSTRQMLLFERAMYRYEFAIFEEIFYSRVYRWFIEFEKDFRGLQLKNYETDMYRYLLCTWSRPKSEWVDPLKDIKAVQLEIDIGGSTLTEYLETQGRDIEEVVATRKYERTLLKEAGLLRDVEEIELIEEGEINNAE